MNYSIIISPLFRLLYLFSPFFWRKKKQLLCAYFWGGAYFWEGAYYRSLISSLQQMRLLLGGAYYRGALIIGSLRYYMFKCNDSAQDILNCQSQPLQVDCSSYYQFVLYIYSLLSYLTFFLSCCVCCLARPISDKKLILCLNLNG